MSNLPAAPAAPRAVLDTSTLVSAHRHWLWLLAWQGYYEGIWSPFIIAELTRVRWTLATRHGTDPVVMRQRINDLIHAFSAVLETATYTAQLSLVQGLLPDPDDEPVLAAALAANADYIVSLNTRDFPVEQVILGVRFITPHDFLTVLEQQYPSATLRTLAAD